MQFPSRFIHLDEARRRHGDRVDRYGRFLTVGDPLADDAVEALHLLPRDAREAMVDRALARGIAEVPDAPEAVKRLFAEVERVPFWVDPERMNRGGAAFLRSGFLGGIVLGSYSLVAGYCSPAGNKPLMFSGRLEQETPRRLAETSRFVEVVSTPGEMAVGREGYRYTVRVRLIHASVRRMLERSPRWNSAAWGLPINQADRAGTTLLFSLIALDGLDKLGFVTTPSEREDFLHLWRYAGYLLGVDESLRCTTEAEARTLFDLLSMTQAPPDDDARALTRAFLGAGVVSARSPEERRRAERMRPVMVAVTRYLVGDRYADYLGLERSPGDLVFPLVRAANEGSSALARAVPGIPRSTVEAGRRYWSMITTTTLRGVPASFPMPERLRGG